MNTKLLFTAIFATFMAGCLAVSGQQSPFAAKSKPAGPAGFMPKAVKPIPGLTANTAGRLQQVQPFRPVTHPFPASIRSAEPGAGKHYNREGRLIFLVPGQGANANANLPAPVTLEEACYRYLGTITGDLRIHDVKGEFTITRTHSDELGMSHVRMQQVFHGIPVYNGELYIHTRGNQVVSLNGNPYPTPELTDLTPSVSEFGAGMTAIADVSARTRYYELDATQKSLLGYDGPAARLVIYAVAGQPGRMILAWHVTVRPNFIERWEYFVNATDGSVIERYNNTHSDGDVTSTGPDLNGVNRTIHAYKQGNSYLMVDVSRPMYNPQNQEGTLRVYDANYTCPFVQGFNPGIATTSNNSWGPKVISAQYNSGVTYEHHRTFNNKNSWNNQGGSFLSVINATTENGGGLDNAFWNGVCLIYGNGATYFTPLQGALDVVAHEIGHAYDEGSANLEYKNQSGALNEAYADIAGVCVERQNWKMGEDIVRPGVFPTGCMRDMSNPHNGGNSLSDPGYQPAHVSEMYTGSDDNGGVHINSGIINFAFYKYVMVVGMDDGEKVFMRALFNYLTRSSQFIDCRLAVIQSAKDLFGDGSQHVTAAMNAFQEVGIGEGSGGNYQNQLPVNPGQDYIMIYDTDPADPNSIYIAGTDGQSFTPISTTEMANKPSIVDNGSVAVFIGADKKMHSITLSFHPQEQIIQDEAIWSNVAVSKDGSMIAAVTEYQDSSIYIYSFQKQEWVRAYLYNPTTQTGVVTYNVLYADALEWDYSGEYLMYDAYNQMNSSTTGQNVDYWDISFINVWNKAASNWGTGQIFKLVSGIPEGVSIGNPSLAKNSPSVCAFDYYDANTNSVSVLASNLETGDFVEIFANGSTLSYPNYSKLDNKIIFTATYQGNSVIAYMEMQPDKIHPNGTTAYLLINKAMWGVWYAQGNRPLGEEELARDSRVKIYPNPAGSSISIDMEKVIKGPVMVDILDSKGVPVKSFTFDPAEKRVLDLEGLAAGIYLVRVTGDDFSATEKLVKY